MLLQQNLITTAEFNVLLSAAYGNRIVHSEQKITKIKLGAICTHMADFRTSSHIYRWWKYGARRAMAPLKILLI